MKTGGSLAWPVGGLPRLLSSGQYPLAPDDFKRVYLGRTHALHVHAYAGEIRIGAHHYVLHPGDLTISPAGQPSCYRLAVTGRHWCVHFRPAQPCGDCVVLPLHLPLGGRRAHVIDRLKHITRYHNHPAPTEAGRSVVRGVAAASFQELLLWLSYSFAHAVPREGATRLQKALDELVVKLEDELSSPLRVTALARTAGLNQNYLARQFRARFGMTIQRYVFLRRMEQAKNLLVNTHLPVKSIAVHVGYPDPQHFNKAFRRAVGMCPSAFRREAEHVAGRGWRTAGGMAEWENRGF
ncbi:MAG: helix-turn-helix transcriptional regulator [Kiritimatiellae bacterium]|nr:helix-turn-helix transcriptional regulator [Kiritimatiellia bacterium]